MRSSIARGVKSATSAVRGKLYQTTQSRALYICAECRRTAYRSRSDLAPPSRRPFSSTLRSRQESFTTSQLQPAQERALPQTHYDLFPSTFPKGPPPASPFTPNLQALRKEFLSLQSVAHPDLAAAGQKRQAEGLSSRINEAYKTLQDPLRRAQYLLSLRGIDLEDDSAKLEENELLMEVMEAREAVDEAETEADLVSLRAENDARTAESVSALEAAFAGSDVDRAAHEAVRLRYWKNIEESIHGWEQGKGGGLIHH